MSKSMKTITCKYCGEPKEYEAWMKKEFCSRKCAALYNKRKIYPVEKRVCKNCSKEFDFSPSNSQGLKGIFCCQTCNLEYSKKNALSKMNVCEYCKKEFLVNSHIKNQKYCSPECFQKSRSQRDSYKIAKMSKPIVSNTDLSLQQIKTKVEMYLLDKGVKRIPHEHTFYSNNRELYNSILAYPFRGEDLSFQNRIYLSLHDLEEVPKCIICGKDVRYSYSSEKWGSTCSNTCKSKLQTINLSPSFNRSACEVFKKLDYDLDCVSGVDSRFGLYGNGELCVLDLYWLDYINYKYKIIIEWQERNHKYTKQRDAWKEKQIKLAYPDFKYITIWEKEYLTKGKCLKEIVDCFL